MGTPSSPNRRSGGPSLLLKLSASAVLTAALMLVLEFVAGFFVAPPQPKEIPGDVVSRTVTYIEVNPAPLVRDVDLLWRNEPGARKTQLVNPQAFSRADQWTIENNSEGYRGPERQKTPNSEGLFRILCVGDSITFGFSADQGETYPQQLLDILRQRYPGRDFEVVNAGVPGWSYLQGLRFLDLHGPEIDPDLIIIGHGTNDQLFEAKVTDEERFLRLAGPVKKAAQKLAVLAVETNTYQAISRLMPKRPDDQPSPGCQKQILQTGGCRRMSTDQIGDAVVEVARLAKDRGVELLVANTDFVQTAAVQGVRRGVEASGAPYIDLVDELEIRRQADQNARAARLGLAKESPEIVPGNARNAGAPKRVTLRAVVPDTTHSYRVVGGGNFHPEFAFDQPLRDDGQGGDEKAGDGVFTTVLDVPAQYSSIVYKFYQGEIAEFAAVPPMSSTLGDRLLRIGGDRTGPVDEFGKALFMVERAHPNGEGHRVIAELLADRIQQTPAFQRFLASGGPAPGAGSH